MTASGAFGGSVDSGIGCALGSAPRNGGGGTLPRSSSSDGSDDGGLPFGDTSVSSAPSSSAASIPLPARCGACNASCNWLSVAPLAATRAAISGELAGGGIICALPVKSTKSSTANNPACCNTSSGVSIPGVIDGDGVPGAAVATLTPGADGMPCSDVATKAAAPLLATWPPSAFDKSCRNTTRAAFMSGIVADGAVPDANEASRNRPEFWNAAFTSSPVRFWSSGGRCASRLATACCNGNGRFCNDAASPRLANKVASPACCVAATCAAVDTAAASGAVSVTLDVVSTLASVSCASGASVTLSCGVPACEVDPGCGVTTARRTPSAVCDTASCRVWPGCSGTSEETSTATLPIAMRT